MSNTKRLYGGETHPQLQTSYLSRTFLQAMVPTNFIVNCKLYLTCYAFWFHLNFFVVPLGLLNFIVRSHHRTVHKHLLSTPESNQKAQLLGMCWLSLPKRMHQTGADGPSLLVSVLSSSPKTFTGWLCHWARKASLGQEIWRVYRV
jgi:hypothetical protein